MPATVNPLMPTAYDVVWGVISLVALVLAVIALISLARAAKNLTAGQRVLWVLATIFVPVLGPAAWLTVGRRAAVPAVE